MRRVREHIPASKARAKRRKSLYLKVGIVACFLILAIGGLVFTLRLPSLQVTSVEVVGASTLATEDLRASIDREMDGSYLLVVPRSSIFLYPKRSIENALSEQYPKLRSVGVRFKDFGSIAVSVSEREPSALWCGASSADARQCYFMDAQGLLYAPAPSFSGPVYVSYYGALSSDVPLRASFLGEDRFASLAALVATLGKEDSPVSVEITPEKDVIVTFLSGSQLIFALADAPEGILARLSAARASDALAGVSPEDISYIDLRFGNKLYYRLKE